MMSLLESINWLELSIGDIADVIAGGTPKAGNPENFQEPGSGIAWLTPADLSGYKDKYISYGARDLSQQGYDSSSAKLLPKDSLVFSSRAPIGYVAIAKNEISTNQGFKNFVFTYGVDSSFAYYYLRNIKDLAESLGTGSTFKEISGATAKTLPFLLPPLAEQKIIADKLDTLMAQVETIKARLERLPKLLKTFRQSVLADAVSGKLTEEWRASLNQQIGNVKPLATAGKIIAGQSPSKSEVNFDGKGEPYVTGPEQWDGRQISHYKWTEHPKRIAPDGSIFITVKGAGVGTTFPGCYAAIGRDVYAFVPNENMNYTYILLAIQASAEDVVLKAKGLIPGLTKRDIVDHEVYLPPTNEQTEIVRRVEELFAFADSIEQKANTALERVNNLTQSILAKAFRGELTAEWRAANPRLIRGENSAEALLKKIKAEREVLKSQPKRTVVKRHVGKRMSKEIISVVEALKEAGKALSGQQLLAAAGYPSDSTTEQLEQFFLDIRDSLVIKKSITKLERGDDEQDWFTVADTTAYE